MNGLTTHPVDTSLYPRLFVLYCPSLGTVEYTSDSYSRVSLMFKSMPLSVRQHFEILRYDVHGALNNKRKGKNQ